MIETIMKLLKKICILYLVSATIVILSREVNAASGISPPIKQWSFSGLFGTFDRASTQRGLQVYREICSGCHSLNLIAFRNLVDLGYDEDQIKESLLGEGANPLQISKNLAEIKSTQVSNKNPDRLVLGADSVISLNDELINKPNSRKEALEILKKLNNSKHYLISSVCISKNGSMIWNHSDSSELKMKNLVDAELSKYLAKIETRTLLDYGVYQIEADGLKLFEYIKGDQDSIMGLPIKDIINYINQYNQ